MDITPRLYYYNNTQTAFIDAGQEVRSIGAASLIEISTPKGQLLFSLQKNEILASNLHKLSLLPNDLVIGT
jgi:hypothetical protein